MDSIYALIEEACALLGSMLNTHLLHGFFVMMRSHRISSSLPFRDKLSAFLLMMTPSLNTSRFMSEVMSLIRSSRPELSWPIRKSKNLKMPVSHFSLMR